MTPLRQRMLQDMQVTAQYLCLATNTICATASPFDLLPGPVPLA